MTILSSDQSLVNLKVYPAIRMEDRSKDSMLKSIMSHLILQFIFKYFKSPLKS